MNDLIKYGLIALAIGGLYFYGGSGSNRSSANNIDLNKVLDITVETIYAFEEKAGGEKTNSDQAFVEFASALQSNYNSAAPKLYTSEIAVQPNADSSLIAYVEANGNQKMDEGEDALFLIEVDGENSRIIATGRDGAVNEHRFSGGGFLTGYLIASMLTRQRVAGVNPSNLANKKTVSARQAARSRAGSGSHSRGK